MSEENVPEPVLITGEPASPEQPKNQRNFVVGVCVVIILIVAGLLAQYVHAAPGRAWKKFIASTPTSKIVTSNFDVSYQDHGSVDSSDKSLSFVQGFLSQAHFSLKGNSYGNASDIQNPEGTSEINYSLGSGSSSYNSKLHGVFKDQNMYLDLGTNPLFAGLLATVNPTKKTDWIKFNLPAIKEEINKTAPSSTTPFDFQKQMSISQDIMQKYQGKVFLLKSYIGSEKINGVATFHYSNTLDKQEFKNMAYEYADNFYSQLSTMGNITPDEALQAKQVLHHLVDVWVTKLEIKTLETWVGKSDSKLYKISFISTAPSVSSLVTEMSKNMNTTEGSENPEQGINKIIDTVSFAADFSLQEDFLDYGKTKEVTVPTDSLDFLEMIQQQEKNNAAMMGDSGI